jgi:hypothetical protein
MGRPHPSAALDSHGAHLLERRARALGEKGGLIWDVLILPLLSTHMALTFLSAVLSAVLERMAKKVALLRQTGRGTHVVRWVEALRAP